MRGEIFDALVGLGLFVGAVEILQREGDIVGQPLQQLDEFGRERVLLERHEQHDADGLPRAPAGNAAPDCAPCRRAAVVKRLGAAVGQIVVGDAGLAASGTPCPHSPRPSGCAGLIEIRTCRALAAVGPAAATTSRQSLSGLVSAMEVEVNLPPSAAASQTSSNNSARRFRAHDRLVGRAQRRQHARQPLLLLLGPRLLVGAVEILQRERHVVGQSLQQLRRIPA